ncbi:MAG: hypothetical protein M1151_03915 [Candidatus Thermoplasmatota archaeon]|jgi:hypothetical protein|nr:hypothetical protein [Candidatus Thermoplasmatota archaeon]MCL5785802.1 hypothetical protein [Candidatus Thermoplasmatota archaeon]
MDAYDYFWGAIKFLVPAILFGISLYPPVDYLLMFISIIWAFAALTISALNMNPSSHQERKF